jgi:hypothetical protein
LAVASGPISEGMPSDNGALMRFSMNGTLR